MVHKELVGWLSPVLRELEPLPNDRVATGAELLLSTRSVIHITDGVIVLAELHLKNNSPITNLVPVCNYQHDGESI